MSHDVKTKDDIAQIASISAANPEVGKLIADAMEKLVMMVSLRLKNLVVLTLLWMLLKECNLIVVTCHNTW
jgi:chaperonin GroEL (HSP60 family)